MLAPRYQSNRGVLVVFGLIANSVDLINEKIQKSTETIAEKAVVRTKREKRYSASVNNLRLRVAYARLLLAVIYRKLLFIVFKESS